MTLSQLQIRRPNLNHQFPSVAFTLVAELQEPANTAAVCRTEADPRAREELLLAKLGPKGWGRLYSFRRFYSSGWGGGSGKPLSPRALETFYRFLETATFPGTTKPSIFLTDKGYIELCWEDAGGKAVQLEFRRHEIEFYVESRGTEGSLPNSRARSLSRRLAHG